MRTHATRILACALLSGGLLLSGASPALADDEQSDSAEPTEAGTTFRTATAIEPEGHASTNAAVGDYLYWVFPVAAGQDATAEATVTFPGDVARTGPSTWQLDVYDGLRRRQACVSGQPTADAAQDAESVTVTCTLRTVRSWAEPWATDPLPGAYYLRLTAVDLAETDRGLPLHAELDTHTEGSGGDQAGGGELPTPLVPATKAGTIDPTSAGAKDADGEDGTSEDEEPDAQIASALEEPEGGWNAGWWSDRWLWTAGGGALGTAAGLFGFHLTRRTSA